MYKNVYLHIISFKLNLFRMKTIFTFLSVFCCLYLSLAQDSWVKFYDIESAIFLEETSDDGLFIYMSNGTRMKVNEIGDSLYIEPFQFPKKNSVYSYANSMLTKKDTLGNILWSKPAGRTHQNLELHVTNSDIAYIIYEHPNLISGYAFITVFDPCLLYTSPSPRDATLSRMPSSA